MIGHELLHEVALRVDNKSVTFKQIKDGGRDWQIDVMVNGLRRTVIAVSWEEGLNALFVGLQQHGRTE